MRFCVNYFNRAYKLFVINLYSKTSNSFAHKANYLTANSHS